MLKIGFLCALIAQPTTNGARRVVDLRSAVRKAASCRRLTGARNVYLQPLGIEAIRAS